MRYCNFKNLLLGEKINHVYYHGNYIKKTWSRPKIYFIRIISRSGYPSGCPLTWSWKYIIIKDVSCEGVDTVTRTLDLVQGHCHGAGYWPWHWAWSGATATVNTATGRIGDKQNGDTPKRRQPERRQLRSYRRQIVKMAKFAS